MAGGEGIQQSISVIKQGSTNALSALATLLVLWWQSIVVARYIKDFPESLWTGEARFAMNDSCRSLLWVMRWTVLLSFFILIAEFVLACLFATPAIRSVCTPCIGLLAIADGVAQLAKFAMWIWGLAVLLNVDEHQAEACSDLALCAWWTYLGIFLVSLAVMCCVCCCSLGRQSANNKATDERTPLLPSGPNPSANAV
mmetsp:Transcript_23717/g.68566  ORF Transcript_23717/g.68566 Transcript_23717/m.68566 type:complete len:198 (+) Transcript_23717:92-685(+)|eukprot:CAMPEP_0170241908 /NCGR_PEP_ID=MMETSP0116_2-20130129/20726_1 /TAXON_ID=400756 /ORGANISM="Durinskia baltica, Strain CSIRO CS-38" /LENGTH=197 /DNA_ID=CAMNT_0010492755 /DNA_START=79 /DNA_END=672 /DNA_ORIENTATION=-